MNLEVTEILDINVYENLFIITFLFKCNTNMFLPTSVIKINTNKNTKSCNLCTHT